MRRKHIVKKSSKPDYNSMSWPKKIWYFIWKDDSLASWIATVILAFILIKFIFYPIVGVALGTNLPVVAVISGSMHHEGNFDTWWNSTPFCIQNSFRCNYTQKDWYLQDNISKKDFLSFPLKNGFKRGDVIVLVKADPLKLKVGDVIVFSSGKPYPIIHRLIGVGTSDGEPYFQTKGDHNPYPGHSPDLDELDIKKNQLRGKAVLRIPYIGYVKLIVSDFLSSFIR